MREVDLIGRIETPITLNARMNANAVTTTNYNELGNKPKINGVTLYGDLTPEELGIFYGAPFVANTVAEMTNTDKVYVYTGSETGYVAGNWYYYNGSEWVSGGVYNSAAVQTDRTLTQEDKAADAKAVGDALAMKAGIIEDTVTGEIVSFVPDKTIDKLLDASLEMSPIQSLNGYDSPWPGGGGKNLIDGEYTTNASGTTSHITTNFVIPTTGATITASAHTEDGTVANTGNCAINFKTSDNTQLLGISPTQTKTALDLSTAAKVEIFTTAALANKKIYVQLEVGSTATAYSPYSNICPISGHTGAELIRTGKNLLPHKFYQFNSSQLSVGTDTSTTYAHYLKAGTYTLSASLMGQARWIIREEHDTANTNVGGTLISANPHGTFTIDKDGMYRIWLYGSGITAEMVSWFQLELGSSATAYEPYDGDTYSVTFTDQGTVYGGTYDFVSGKLTVTWKATVLTAVNDVATLGGYPCARFLVADLKSNTPETHNDFICSHFGKVSGYVGGYPGNGQVANQYFNYLNVVMRNDALTTASDWNTWLAAQNTAGTPVTIVHALATPLEYTLSPQQLTTLFGQNVVWGNGTATVKYAADAKTYIDNKIAAAVAALS